MRFLVLFREDKRVSAKGLEDMYQHLLGLEKQGKVVGETVFAVGQGVATMFEVASRDEVEALAAETPLRDLCSVEIVPLLDGSDFPMVFGKQRGQLAVWEQVMARR